MKFIEWEIAFSLGDKQIDAQHKAIIESVNGLHETFMTPCVLRDGFASDQVLRFENLVAAHLFYEENIVKRSADGNVEKRIAYHGLLMQWVYQISYYLNSGKRVYYPEVFDFLKKILLEHILVRDRALVGCVEMALVTGRD